jgi:hypothetical protein
MRKTLRLPEGVPRNDAQGGRRIIFTEDHKDHEDNPFDTKRRAPLELHESWVFRSSF